MSNESLPPDHGEHRLPGEPAAAHDTVAGQGIFGSLALFFGIAVFCLAAVDQTAGLPFRMPRMWYVNRSVWFFLALAAMGAGCVLLRGLPPADERRRTPFRRVILYTRHGCHLCDEARAMLDRHAADLPPIEEIDIDTDPALTERFGTEIPVVEIDGTVRFRGRVNEVLLRRLIDGQRRREVV